VIKRTVAGILRDISVKMQGVQNSSLVYYGRELECRAASWGGEREASGDIRAKKRKWEGEEGEDS